MEYRPSAASFLGSLAYASSPALLVGIVVYFRSGNLPLLMWIVSGITVLVALFFDLQCVFVYLNRLYLDERGVGVAGPLARVAIPWSSVNGATLLERVNAITRTDHLLLIESPGAVLSFNTSTLSPRDEEEVLAKVRARTRLVVRNHKGSV